MKKAADALHQEERSGSKGRKWRKNVKAVEKVFTLTLIDRLRSILPPLKAKVQGLSIH